jgi:BirA family transcriptional regulator, biotin operon repressor / biotin---[acetyl-CoA-carboxylase] ligase
LAESNAERMRRMFDLRFGDSLPLFSKPHFQWGLTTDYVGRRFVYRPTSESTMDDAKRMIQRFSLQNGALVLAETQTAGRGRLGRSWVSPPDVNLYFTVVLYPSEHGLRPLAYTTPLAAALAIEEVASSQGFQIKADLKWPNDVQIGGKKVAGVLVETEYGPERLAAYVGVGINVNLEASAYDEIRDIATSVKEATGAPMPREEVLSSFCNHFESLYEEAKGGSLRPFNDWKARLVTIGQRVQARTPSGIVDGLAVDVAADGALVLQLEDGGRAAIEAGEVIPRQS